MKGKVQWQRVDQWLSEANGIGKTLTAEGYTKCSENQNILYHDHGGNYRNYTYLSKQ